MAQYRIGNLILGAPAKVVRELTDADVAHLLQSAAGYAQKAAQCRSELEQVD